MRTSPSGVLGLSIYTAGRGDEDDSKEEQKMEFNDQYRPPQTNNYRESAYQDCE